MLDVALTVDAKGLSCPMPVIRAKKGIESVAVGEVVEVLSTDPGSVADFAAWTRATGHELVESRQEGSVFCYRIRRRK